MHLSFVILAFLVLAGAAFAGACPTGGGTITDDTVTCDSVTITGSVTINGASNVTFSNITMYYLLTVSDDSFLSLQDSRIGDSGAVFGGRRVEINNSNVTGGNCGACWIRLNASTAEINNSRLVTVYEPTSFLGGNVTIRDSYVSGGGNLLFSGGVSVNASNSSFLMFAQSVGGFSNLSINGARYPSAANGSISLPGSYSVVFTDSTVYGTRITASGNASVDINNSDFHYGSTFGENSSVIVRNSVWDGAYYGLLFNGRYAGLINSNATGGNCGGCWIRFNTSAEINNSRIITVNDDVSFLGGNVTAVGSYFSGGSALSFSGGVVVNASNSAFNHLIPSLGGTSNLSINGAKISGGGSGSVSLDDSYLLSFVNSTFTGLRITAAGNASVVINGSTFDVGSTFSENSSVVINNSAYDYWYNMLFSGRYAGVFNSNMSGYNCGGCWLRFNASTVYIDNSRLSTYYEDLSFLGGNVTAVGSYFSGASTLSFSGGVFVNASNSVFNHLNPSLSGSSNLSISGAKMGGGGSGSVSLDSSYLLSFVNSTFTTLRITAAGNASVVINGSTFDVGSSFTGNSSVIIRNSAYDYWYDMVFNGRYAGIFDSNLSGYNCGGCVLRFNSSVSEINNSRLSTMWDEFAFVGGNATVSNSVFSGGGYLGGLMVRGDAFLMVNNSDFYSTNFYENSAASISSSRFTSITYLRDYAQLNFTYPASNFSDELKVYGPNPDITGYFRLTSLNLQPGVILSRWFPMKVMINGAPGVGKTVKAWNSSGFGFPNATTGTDGIGFAETDSSDAAALFNITAYGSELGTVGVVFNQSVIEALLVNATSPDLAVSASELWFAPAGPYDEGAGFSVTATVRNIGLGNASNATVYWYDGAVIFNSSVFDLAAGGLQNFTVTRTAATGGPHVLTVVVDAEGDANVDNDHANSTYDVNVRIPVPAMVSAPEFGLLSFFILSALAGLAFYTRRASL